MCSDIDEAIEFGEVIVTAHSLNLINGKLRDDQQLINLGHEIYEATENLAIKTPSF